MNRCILFNLPCLSIEANQNKLLLRFRIRKVYMLFLYAQFSPFLIIFTRTKKFMNTTNQFEFQIIKLSNQIS